MNYLSLFSGIGGLDLGLDRAGMTCVGQVELDPWCRKVLAKHWPEVPKHDDVRTAPQWWLGGARPAVGLVAGGFPCQPFSTAGRRRGLADERWGWPWFYEVVRAVRPRYVLVENVAALLRNAGAWGWLLADLAESGYDAEWDCIPAAAVGAPHRRDRVFLVAHAQRELVRDQSVAEPGGGRSAGIGDDGALRPVAYADCSGLERPRLQWAAAERRRHGANPAGGERQPPQSQGVAPPRRPATEPGERGGVGGSLGDWWAAEPDVGRVADGVPGRVDRLRGLGNAVVPQVAEHVGRLIIAADRERVVVTGEWP